MPGQELKRHPDPPLLAKILRRVLTIHFSFLSDLYSTAHTKNDPLKYPIFPSISLGSPLQNKKTPIDHLSKRPESLNLYSAIKACKFYRNNRFYHSDRVFDQIFSRILDMILQYHENFIETDSRYTLFTSSAIFFKAGKYLLRITKACSIDRSSALLSLCLIIGRHPIAYDRSATWHLPSDEQDVEDINAGSCRIDHKKHHPVAGINIQHPKDDRHHK